MAQGHERHEGHEGPGGGIGLRGLMHIGLAWLDAQGCRVVWKQSACLKGGLHLTPVDDGVSGSRHGTSGICLP